MSEGRPVRCAAGVLLFLALLAAGACGEQGSQPPGGPPEVVVARAEKGLLPNRREYVGTVRAVDAVDVRARVRGFLVEQRFVEGERVGEGDVLFVIDREPFEVALREARAERARAQATLRRAERDYERSQELSERQVVSLSVLDAERAAFEEAQATFEAARAAVATAELDLSYTTVVSPLAGRVGLARVDVGNLVGENGQDTMLGRVVQMDPIHVYFAPGETDRLARRFLAVGSDASAGIPVEIVLGDGTHYPHRGHVDFVDPEVDVRQGTVTARAEVPNPDHELKPGGIVRAVVVLPEAEGIQVPEKALRQEQGSAYLLVVNDEDVVEFRPVTVGIASDGKRQITSGLREGERVVVEGVQKARPGSKVVPRMVDADGSSQASPPEADAGNPGTGAPQPEEGSAAPQAS